MLHQGAIIGILGAGQLGRMLSKAAQELGFKAHIYAPDEDLADTPAGQIADEVSQGAYEDETGLANFAAKVSVITYEFENVPQSAVTFLGKLKDVRPSQKALEVSQDRWAEKSFLHNLGIPVTDFYDITTIESLYEAWQAMGGEGILKTRRFGYDGKGQWRLKSEVQLETAFKELVGRGAILERLVPFKKEISLIAVRNIKGECAIFDCAENIHQNHILKYSYAPAHISVSLSGESKEIARKILAALDYIGVLAIEFFVCADGLWVNEIAPRVHNSGHWTMDACSFGQFHQHILAVTGQSLANPERHHDAVMTNLIGQDIIRARTTTMPEQTFFHDYNKHETKEGRKMGHINKLYPIGQRPAA